MDYENGQIEPESSPPKVYKLPPEELDTEFKKEFPPDPVIGSEMNDAARVWKVYRREAMAFDSTLLDGWSSTLEILLIFAGLFSAVATAFVIESYQLLQPDNAAYTAAALYILVAASNNTTGLNLPPPPDLAFASPLTRWINGLWFTSILLSLTVALLSILVKQWITEYRARNNASAQSARHWAHRHWLFSQALRAWPVAELVSFLPVLLHLSLFLFFAGVIAFLWSLDRAIGIWIVVLGLSLAFFYAACTLIPVWIPECPTSTPLVAQMRKVLVPAALILLRAFVSAYALGLRLSGRMRTWWKRMESTLAHSTQICRTDNDTALPSTTPHLIPGNIAFPAQLQRLTHRLEALQHDTPVIYRQLDQQKSDNLDASTLCWLIEDVPDSDAVAVALQAVGAIHPASSLADQLRNHGNIVDFAEETAYTKSAAAASASEVLRVMRSTLCMRKTPPELSQAWYSILPCDYPDIYLLCRDYDIKNIEDNGSRLLQQTSDSLTSTAILSLCSEPSLFRKLSCLACCDFRRLSPDVDGNLILDLLCSDLATQMSSFSIVLRDRPVLTPCTI
ncbi:hypothetical protein EXIGLDRAFT_103525 [Exidia glandulosa HHB12029]|uniref:DUF6535 domain-containing protein n=1 Tax=Exidia glandulosa HHB12029 TaxID=1314781 RepID=A0A165GX78_EXIGL|nr:hypothetical protein EXIGLDRAFT_103525 [Exidia glandulosa HHB12029]